MSGRDIAAEIFEGLDDAAAYLDGRPINVRATTVKVPEQVDVRAVRQAVGASQAEFAARFGISLDTVRNWEQGRRYPEGPARTLLRLIDRAPDAVLHALEEGR